MITGKIQALLDRNVSGSPRARQLLAQLEGKRLEIVARYTPWRVTLHAHAGRLQLVRGGPLSRGASLPRAGSDAIDAALSGTPPGLLALAKEPPADVIRRGDVTITGDGEVAARFQELALLLRPDMEAELARIVGDVPAFSAGQLLRRALDYGRSTLRTGGLNVGEYLTHERRTLVPQAEAAQFLHEVDALREHADRLAARVALLEAAQGRAAREAP